MSWGDAKFAQPQSSIAKLWIVTLPTDVSELTDILWDVEVGGGNDRLQRIIIGSPPYAMRDECWEWFTEEAPALKLAEERIAKRDRDLARKAGK